MTQKNINSIHKCRSQPSDTISRRKELLRNKSTNQGFTLLELLGVLALASVLVCLAVPNYSRWLENTQLEITTRTLLAALHFARNTAIQHHADVMLCSSHDKIRCGGHWKAGWILLFTQGGETKDRLLRRYPKLNVKQTLIWKAALSAESLQFDAMGVARVGPNGRFVLCSRHSKTAWIIYVSKSGQFRLEQSPELSQCKE